MALEHIRAFLEIVANSPTGAIAIYNFEKQFPQVSLPAVSAETNDFYREFFQRSEKSRVLMNLRKTIYYVSPKLKAKGEFEFRRRAETVKLAECLMDGICEQKAQHIAEIYDLVIQDRDLPVKPTVLEKNKAASAAAQQIVQRKAMNSPTEITVNRDGELITVKRGTYLDAIASAPNAAELCAQLRLSVTLVRQLVSKWGKLGNDFGLLKLNSEERLKLQAQVDQLMNERDTVAREAWVGKLHLPDSTLVNSGPWKSMETKAPRRSGKTARRVRMIRNTLGDSR